MNTKIHICNFRLLTSYPPQKDKIPLWCAFLSQNSTHFYYSPNVSISCKTVSSKRVETRSLLLSIVSTLHGKYSRHPIHIYGHNSQTLHQVTPECCSKLKRDAMRISEGKFREKYICWIPQKTSQFQHQLDHTTFLSMTSLFLQTWGSVVAKIRSRYCMKINEGNEGGNVQFDFKIWEVCSVL